MAARTFRSIVVIFVKYREVPTHTTLSNFIGNCGDSVVFMFLRRRRQKRERGTYVEEAHVRQVLSCFSATPPVNQNNSPGQPKESLRVATAIRYNYYVQLVATKRSQMRVANLKFWSARQRGGEAQSCTVLCESIAKIKLKRASCLQTLIL